MVGTEYLSQELLAALMVILPLDPQTQMVHLSTPVTLLGA
jgi:hypothetical protein